MRTGERQLFQTLLLFDLSGCSKNSEVSKVTVSILDMSRASDPEAIDLLGMLLRQVRVVSLSCFAGLCLSIGYLAIAAPVYESRCKLLLGLAGQGLFGEQQRWSNVEIRDSFIADHIEIITSRRVLEGAIASGRLDRDPTLQIKASSDSDLVTVLSTGLTVYRGGEGQARDAHTLNIEFRHNSPATAATVLKHIVSSYDRFIDHQVEQAAAGARAFIHQQREEVDARLNELQKRLDLLRRKTDGTADTPDRGSTDSPTAESPVRRQDTVNPRADMTLPQERTLINEIERQRILLDQKTRQLNDVSMAAAAAGQNRDLLNPPGRAEQVWPDWRICLTTGVGLGLLFGLSLASVRDYRTRLGHRPNG